MRYTNGKTGEKMEALDKQFGITDAGSTVEGEIRAGITTFMTMAYILLVNPAMLSGTGLGFDEALFATAIAAFVGCTVMGLWANLPFALAPGMGLNAYFTFGVVIGMGIAWEVALAAVLVEGIIFMIISIPQVGWRTKMINAIPTDLKIATGAGIGMFLAIIGLEETGLVVNNAVTLVDLPATGMWEYDAGELIAIVGPCLNKENFEVGEEFKDVFITQDLHYENFFTIKSNQQKSHFDMRGLINYQLQSCSVNNISNIDIDTY